LHGDPCFWGNIDGLNSNTFAHDVLDITAHTLEFVNTIN
jgi:hypothetical protein